MIVLLKISRYFGIMRLTVPLVLVLGLCCVATVFARKFDSRCKLVREILKAGLPNDLFLGNSVAFAKVIETRCKLVRELLRIGVPNDIFLGQWVCLIEKVSNRDTSAFTVSPSGKKSYGLFQIPSRWCKEGRKGGDCNVACESLLDDDIRDDVACAVVIFQREGFKYWTQWETRCKNDNFITNEIYKCPDLMSPRSSPERSLSHQALPMRRRRTSRGHWWGRPGIDWVPYN